MGWLISRFRPPEPRLLNKFFRVLGKSLYIANAFESKCKFVLNITRLGKCYDETGDGHAAFELARSLKDKMLDGTIKELRTILPVRLDDDADIARLEQQIDALFKAKDARNFIAHEGGNIGYIYDARASHIREQLDALRAQVRLLAAGDNVISTWVFEIEEKDEVYIPSIRRFYPAVLERWVFDGPASFDADPILRQEYEARRKTAVGDA